jgi:hypothetical protein
MAVKLSPVFNDAQTDSAGNPYSGAQLFTYAATSSTKQTTYTENTGSISQANPIILNSSGFPSSPIWLTAGSTYKFVLAPANDTDPPASAIRTIDNVSGVNDTTSVVDEWVAGPTPTYSSATVFTLVGNQTTTFHLGRRVKATISGNSLYGTISVTAFTTLTTVTVVWDSGSLDATLSAISYGLVSTTNSSIGGWITFTPTMTLVGGAGNTVPVYSTNTGRYTRIGNTIFVNVYLTGDGGAEGAGTGQINIALPVAVSANFPTTIYQAVGQAINGAANYLLVGILQASGTTIKVSFLNTVTALISAVTGADQNNTARTLTLSFSYEA